MVDVPAQALDYGFLNAPSGSHTSRTMMLRDLRTLFAFCPPDAQLDTYRAAVVNANALGKQTLATRRASFRQLHELYALDPDVLIFRALRDLWDSDLRAQPLLAALCAVARDPILRSTTSVILDAEPGDEVTSAMMAAAVQDAFPDRYLESVRKVIGRNVIGTWRQSGHVTPTPQRRRIRAERRPAATAYALFLGHLCGARGDLLFSTLWCRLLDAPIHLLREDAITASRQGWIEYRHAGSVTDITFRHLEREEDRRPW